MGYIPVEIYIRLHFRAEMYVLFIFRVSKYPSNLNKPFYYKMPGSNLELGISSFHEWLLQVKSSNEMLIFYITIMLYTFCMKSV